MPRNMIKCRPVRVGIHGVGDEWSSESHALVCMGGGPGSKATRGYSGQSYLRNILLDHHVLSRSNLLKQKYRHVVTSCGTSLHSVSH